MMCNKTKTIIYQKLKKKTRVKTLEVFNLIFLIKHFIFWSKLSISFSKRKLNYLNNSCSYNFETEIAI